MREGEVQASQRAGCIDYGLALSSPLAAVLRDVFGAYDPSMQRPRDQGSAFHLARLGVRDGDMIHLQGAPQGAFVAGFGFLKIGERAQLRALRGDEVALRENHVVNGGSTQPVFLLRGIEGLLLEFARFAGGLDLGAAMAVHWQAPLAAYVTALEASGEALVATAQILGGKILAELELPGERAIVTVVGGAFPAAPGLRDGTPQVIEIAPPAGLDDLAMSLVAVSEPQGGDVDITAADLLVSVGRGIESKDNVELVQELGDALGVPLSASRPVVDAGGLPKSRQVGKSGMKVKPKAYLAFGISGAPEHLEGMRDAELIIASRRDPAAFRELYDRWAERLLAYFYRRVLDPEAAAALLAVPLVAVVTKVS